MIKSRIRFLAIAVICVALLLVVKLYSLQIVHYEDFAERADRQYLRPSNAFNRGNIYFTDKDGKKIFAATTKTGFILAINPKILPQESVGDIYNALKKIVPELSHSDFEEKAKKTKDSYEELAKRLTEDQGKAITALKYKGVNVYKERWRYYPGKELAAHVLGFIGFKGNEVAGRYGLERQYEKTLARNSEGVYANFFVEMFSNIKEKVVDGEALEGDVITTIEPTTQAYVENMLKQITKTYNS
jgi:cell division protein FtsI/penicillin-binding protein 2